MTDMARLFTRDWGHGIRLEKIEELLSWRHTYRLRFLTADGQPFTLRLDLSDLVLSTPKPLDPEAVIRAALASLEPSS